MQHVAGLLHSLSGRELELLTLASEGMTDSEIAAKLGISMATVGSYWSRVRIKFGPMNRTELVATYLNDRASDELERVRTESELRVEAILQKHGVLESALDEAPHALLVADDSGQIFHANRAAAALFQRSHDELVGLRLDDLLSGKLGKVKMKLPGGARTEAHIFATSIPGDPKGASVFAVHAIP